MNTDLVTLLAAVVRRHEQMTGEPFLIDSDLIAEAEDQDIAIVLADQDEDGYVEVTVERADDVSDEDELRAAAWMN